MTAAAGQPPGDREPAVPSNRSPEHRPPPVTTPTILQMEATECGAACLAIVLAHHGLWKPLEELRTACGVSRDGSKASLLLRAARHYGLAARGLKLDPARLEQLAPPTIVFWNFDHFVVVDGFSPNWVHLNDPATGPRKVLRAEFDQSFTGVVLTFQPTEAFRRGGEPRRVAAGLLKRLRGHGATVFYLASCACLLLVPSLLVPLLSRAFIDDVAVSGHTNWLLPLLGALVATAAARALLTWMQRAVLTKFEVRLASAESARFFWHVLRLPMRFFAQRSSGDIAARVAINDAVASLLANDLAVNALNVLVIAFYAAAMFRYDVTLTLIAVAVSVLNLAALRLVSRARVDATSRMMQDRGKLIGTAMGSLHNIESVKAAGGEADVFTRWAGYHTKIFNTEQQMRTMGVWLSTLPLATGALYVAVVLGLGGTRVMDGALTIGMLLAFQTLYYGFSSPIHQVLSLAREAEEMTGGMARLDDVLSNQLDPQFTPMGHPLTARQPIQGRLELRSITFGYADLDEPLLRDFTLTLTPGQRVALVGGSGSGKSTVAKIASGLYEPWSGDVLIDGHPRGLYRRDLVCRQLSFVDQEVVLFSGTVRENLTLWDSTVPDAHVVQAARDADIHDDVAVRPGGYEATVEEGGRNFSGGQRQRLEIARALVTNPSILVLDEATSALDAATENRVDDGLRRRGCTCLIVAHRLSTIRDCDEIIVLEGGQVVERGTHEELLAHDARYAALIRTM